MLRGKTITKGYYKKDSQTKEAIDEDGWFHTGDAGFMKNGELYLRERIKDLFKTSNGKFVSALIVPNYALLETYAQDNGITFKDREELCKKPEIIRFYTERIETLQQDLAHYEQIKRFILLSHPFTMDNGELTNTLKVRRRVVYDHYAEQIEQIYAEAEAEAAAATK